MGNEELRNELALLLAEAGIEGIKSFLDELMPEIERRPRFDQESFIGWFKSRNVPFMAKPFGFMRKCIIPDVRSGKHDREEGAHHPFPGDTPDKERYIITEDWLKALRSHDEESDLRIDLALNWLWRETDSGLEEVRELHSSILAWLEGKGRLDSKSYLWALTNSRYFKSKGGSQEKIDELRDGFEKLERGFYESIGYYEERIRKR